MLYVLTQLLAVSTRWEMTGIGAAIAAALFAFLAALSPLRHIVFPPHVVFDGWALGERELSEYRNWHHARFGNHWSRWRASEAQHCEAFAEIEQDGAIRDDPEPLIVARKPNPLTEWTMKRDRSDMIPLILKNDTTRTLGFVLDMGRNTPTVAGTYITDSLFIFGAGGSKGPLKPGDYRVRVRLEYDGRTVHSPWRDVSVS